MQHSREERAKRETVVLMCCFLPSVHFISFLFSLIQLQVSLIAHLLALIHLLLFVSFSQSASQLASNVHDRAPADVVDFQQQQRKQMVQFIYSHLFISALLCFLFQPFSQPASQPSTCTIELEADKQMNRARLHSIDSRLGPTLIDSIMPARWGEEKKPIHRSPSPL